MWTDSEPCFVNKWSYSKEMHTGFEYLHNCLTVRDSSEFVC